MNLKSCFIYFLLLIIAKHANASRFDLLSPINIDTSQVTPTFNPLKISIDIFNTLVSAGPVKNTGKEISFPLPKNQQTFAPRITKGNDTYTLAIRYLLINQNGSQKNRSGHTFNGKGFPVEGVNIFANIDKYQSLEKAKKHPDGILVLSQPVAVTDVPNPTFVPFGKFLRSGKLKTPNSADAPFSTLFSFIWYDSIVKNRAYFIYTGSLYDPETKTQTHQVTQVVTQPPYSSISYEQFTDLKNVLDKDGNPLSTIAPLNPAKGREIKAVKGFILEIRPYHVTSFVP